MMLPILILSALFASAAPAPTKTGALIVVGGGGTPDAAFRRALSEGGGKDARVLVIPFASKRKDAGHSTAEQFRKLGARDIDVATQDARALRRAIADATLIWFPGGSQGELFRILDSLGAVEILRKRHAQGLAFGGTSAGAAVMSRTMIVQSTPGSDGRRAEIGVGLGLWPAVVVDQHFGQRRRFDRLLGTIQSHRELLGVGIDERTAVVVEQDRIEVLGLGRVVILDAREARTSGATSGAASQSLEGIRLHLLHAGDRFDLAKGALLR